MSFAGYEHNPKTMYLAADMPLRLLGAYHGVGLQLMNDEIGLFTHKRILLQYAYKHRLFGGTLSIGIQGGMLSEGFKGSEIELESETADPVFSTTDVNGTAMDLSAGLYYQRKNWYVGFSVLHVTAPEIEIGEKSIYDMSRVFYLTGRIQYSTKKSVLYNTPHSVGAYRRLRLSCRCDGESEIYE